MNKLRSNRHFSSTGIVRFRRWSRNRYAAFRSIGKCVSIGNLSVEIANCSCTKQYKNSKAIQPSLETDLYSPEEYGWSDRYNFVSDLLLPESSFREVTFLAVIHTVDAAKAALYNQIYIYRNRISLFSAALFGFLFFIYLCLIN